MKPKPRSAEHVRYGVGQKFADGMQRTIRLAPEYWLSDISELTSTPPPPPTTKRKRAKSLEEVMHEQDAAV